MEMYLKKLAFAVAALGLLAGGANLVDEYHRIMDKAKVASPAGNALINRGS